MRFLLLFLSLVGGLVSGCSSQSPPTMDMETSGQKPTAMQILRDAGLVAEGDYLSAEFIPNSDETMIVTEARDVPCKIIFLHVTASNGDYWMPRQIGCSQ